LLGIGSHLLWFLSLPTCTIAVDCPSIGDGPTVSAPRRTGFGHVVTGPMMEEALAGKARCDFLPAGVRWSFHGLAELALEGG
jgi:hypothetical protein